MNSNILNIQRLGKLIYRKWFHPTNFAWRNALPIALIPVFLFLFSFIDDSTVVAIGDRTSLFIFLLVVSIVFAPFFYFFNYNHPKKGIIDAMLPASSLEKFLTLQLTGIIYSPIIVLILYGGVDTLLSVIFPSRMPGLVFAELINSIDVNWEELLLIFTAHQSIMFCNLWFRRNKLLKTFGVFVIFYVVVFGIFIGYFLLFIQSLDPNSNINFNIFNDNGPLVIRRGDHPAILLIQYFRIFVDIIMPLGLTIGSYLILKKKKF